MSRLAGSTGGGASKDRHPDTWAVRWDVRGYLQDIKKTALADEFGLSDAALYIWIENGKTGLETFKALMQQAGPTKAEAFLMNAKVEHNRTTRYNDRVRYLAALFDRAHPELVLPIKGGGTYKIPRRDDPPAEPAPKAEPPQNGAPTPSAEFVIEEPGEPAQVFTPERVYESHTVDTPFGQIVLQVESKKTEAEDVLVALAERLRVQRDRVLLDLVAMQSKLDDRDLQLASVQKQLTQAQADLVVYEQLLSETQHQAAGHSAPVSTNGAATARQKIAGRPALLQVLDALPKSQARSGS
jgi:hypothetical protein